MGGLTHDGPRTQARLQAPPGTPFAVPLFSGLRRMTALEAT